MGIRDEVMDKAKQRKHFVKMSVFVYLEAGKARVLRERASARKAELMVQFYRQAHLSRPIITQ